MKERNVINNKAGNPASNYADAFNVSHVVPFQTHITAGSARYDGVDVLLATIPFTNPLVFVIVGFPDDKTLTCLQPQNVGSKDAW